MPGHKKSHKHKINSTTALTQAVAGMALTTPTQSGTPAPAHAASDAGTSSAAPATSSTSQAATAPPAARAPPASTPAAHAATDAAAAAATDPGTSSTAPASSPHTSTSICRQPAAASAFSSAPVINSSSDPNSITWQQVQSIRAAQGLDSTDALHAYLQYTEQLAESGQRDQAITVLQAVLKEAMTTLTADDIVTVTFSMYLAAHLTAAGQYQAALRHWKWCLPRSTSMYGAKSACLSEIVKSTTVCLTALQQYDEALPLAQQAYSLGMDVYGRNHQWTTDALELCMCLMTETQTPAPQAVLEHAEECLQASGGISNIQVYGLCHQLCIAYSRSGQDAAAAKHLPRMVAAAKQLYGEGSQQHLAALRSRAMNAAERKQHAQAASLFQSLLHTTKSKLGERHRDVIRCVYDLGHVFVLAGRHTDAVQVFEHVWPTAKAVLSPKDDLSQSLVAKHCQALQALGREKQARAVGRDAAAWGITPEDVRQWGARRHIQP